MIKKALLAAAALSSAFMLSGCELIFRNTVDCNERPDVCRQNQLIKRANNTQLSSADIYSIDSGKIAVDVSQSNVYFTANSANYTVSGAAVAKPLP